MAARIEYAKVAPAAVRAVLQPERHARQSGLESSLLQLVRLRASQLNGCAYCVDLHSREARAEGETERRLHLLAVWRDAPCYTERERAALAWTEALTLISGTGVPDELYESVRRQFGEAELVELTVAAIAINGLNRLAIPFRTPLPVDESPAAGNASHD